VQQADDVPPGRSRQKGNRHVGRRLGADRGRYRRVGVAPLHQCEDLPRRQSFTRPNSHPAVRLAAPNSGRSLDWHGLAPEGESAAACGGDEALVDSSYVVSSHIERWSRRQPRARKLKELRTNRGRDNRCGGLDEYFRSRSRPSASKRDLGPKRKGRPNSAALEIEQFEGD
jgi:hypothetical protein